MLIYVLYCLFKFRVKKAIDVVYWADYFELKLRYANFNFTKHDGTQSGRLKPDNRKSKHGKEYSSARYLKRKRTC